MQMAVPFRRLKDDRLQANAFPDRRHLGSIRLQAPVPLSFRHLEEMIEERRVIVDHSSISCWSIRFLPLVGKVFRNHKHMRPVGRSRRIDRRPSTSAGTGIISISLSRWGQVTRDGRHTADGAERQGCGNGLLRDSDAGHW